MKSARLLYLVVGFIAGMFYLVACGGGSSGVPEAIGEVVASVTEAITVAYDNATSRLSATNVQAAIDEIKSSIDSLADRVSNLEGGATITSDTFVGGWSGTDFDDRGEVPKAFSITFNSDGTYSCTQTGTTSLIQECTTSGTWEYKPGGLLILMMPSARSGTAYFPVFVVKRAGDDHLTFVWAHMWHVAELDKT